MNFANTVAAEFPLSDDEKDLLSTAHRWLQVYCKEIKEPQAVIPEPRGTTHEAWSTLTMVSILWGYADMFPGLRAKEQVPTQADFMPRIAALVRRLEA